MDALTTYLAASAAVAFFDFAIGLVKTAAEIRDRGSTAKHDDLELRCKNLRLLNERLQQSIDTNDSMLNDLGIKTNEIVIKLEALLQTVKSKDKKNTSHIRALINTLRSISSIQRLERELTNYRQLLGTGMLVSLSWVLVDSPLLSRL